MRRLGPFFFIVLLSLTVYGCGGDDGGASASTPTGAGYMINGSGGTGAEGPGGNGGQIYIEAYGDLKISKSGSVDAGFTVPAAPQAYLGTNQLVIPSNTVIQVYNTPGSDPAAGVAYMVYNALSPDANVYISDGDGAVGDETPVTGLQVNAGVTLTVGLNYSQSGNSGQDTANMSFANDFNILGTLVTNALSTGDVGGAVIDLRHGDIATGGRDRGMLYVSAWRILSGPDAKIDTSGLDASDADTRGGDGGRIYFSDSGGGIYLGGSVDASGGDGLGTGIGGYAGVVDDNTTIGIELNSSGTLVNRASLNSSGGSGEAGGEAGQVTIVVGAIVYNTGNISANGGEGTDGNGGAARTITLRSDNASVFNSGNLSANGGSGTAVGGGSAPIYIYAASNGYSGKLFNSGNLSANGGSSTAAGGGNWGSQIQIETYGGEVRNSGSLSSRGGLSNSAGSGGSGGTINIYSYEGWDYGFGGNVAPGPVKLSGDISTAGGSGPTGGGGGYLNLYTDDPSEDFSRRASIEIYGMGGGIRLGGGPGATAGGSGGDIYIYTYETWIPKEPAGSIESDADIDAKGGAATTSGPGGQGGYLDWGGNFQYLFKGNSVFRNAGNIDVSGGGGVSNGGNSGGVVFFGHDSLENTGDIAANGGAASGAGGMGGNGAWSDVSLYSSYDILNSGKISAVGGEGSGADSSGGSVQTVQIYSGGKTANTGDIYASGGNADGTGTNGTGGTVDLFSGGEATANTAYITVAKGSGGTGTVWTPVNGTIYIDWLDVTPVDGTLP